MNSGEKNINQTNNHAKQAKAKVSEAKHSPENKKTKRQLLMRLIKTEESQKKKDKKIMTNQDSLFFFLFSGCCCCHCCFAYPTEFYIQFSHAES